MSRKKRLATSNENDAIDLFLSSAEEPGLNTDFDPFTYQTKASPRLKVVIAVDNDIKQIEEARVIKHILRRNRIRSSIYSMEYEKHDGVINYDETLFCDAVKTSCCVMILTEKYKKPVYLRACLAGRVSIGWHVVIARNPAIHSVFNTIIERIHQIPLIVRDIKSKYTTSICTSIARSILKF